MEMIRTVSQTPTLDTSAYASGDLAGTKMTFDFSPLKVAAGDLVIDRVLISDLANQGADLDLVLFDADPTNSTFTDNDPADIHDDDLPNIVAVIPVTTHKAFNDNSISYANDLGIRVHVGSKPTDDPTLYGVLVSRGTPTYAASSLVVNLTARVDTDGMAW